MIVSQRCVCRSGEVAGRIGHYKKAPDIGKIPVSPVSSSTTFLLIISSYILNYFSFIIFSFFLFFSFISFPLCLWFLRHAKNFSPPSSVSSDLCKKKKNLIGIICESLVITRCVLLDYWLCSYIMYSLY